MARRSDHTRDELHRLALDAARRITEREGLRGLRARQIARDIGYTIGTLYNLFEDLDDLILHLNGETLDALFATCSRAPAGKGTVADLGGFHREVQRCQANLIWTSFPRSASMAWKGVL
jgi:AcrR family transcriptional regulator